MSKNRKTHPTGKEMQTDNNTELVIENSPDDSPMSATGDEKSLVQVDNPDDVEAEYNKE